MNTDELTDFYMALVGLLLGTKHKVIKVANSHQLTGIQALALTVIMPENPPTMQMLATVFGCDASNVTGIIDGLEAKKLVSRQAKQGDRRVKVVQLEPAGLQLRTQILHEAAGENGTNFMANLTPAERGMFMELVTKINQSCPLQKPQAE